MQANENISVVVRLLMGLHGSQTRADLGRGMGMSTISVSSKLSGTRPWMIQDLDRLAEHFAVPPDTFLRPLDTLVNVPVARKETRTPAMDGP
ncbi:MAG: transcriptional regulator [Frankiales bacterium]|nr:transcriptional regulator [Frankiales bacterium]